MDFRFRYDPVALQPVSVEPGASAIQAGKRVMANVAQPGEYIVVVFGLSSGSEQSVCSDGEIARVIMRTKSTEVMPWGLGLGKATVSASDGTAMPARTTPYQGRNAGTRSPVTPVTVPQETTPETGTAPAPTEKPLEVATPLGQPPVLTEKAGTDVHTALAETRKAREEILKPNAVSVSHTMEDQPAAVKIAAENADTKEAGTAPENLGSTATPAENTGRVRIKGAQVALETPKIENDRPKRSGTQLLESPMTQSTQRAGSSSGLWLVAGIGVLAILILIVLFITRK